jgi:hypothetical protein
MVSVLAFVWVGILLGVSFVATPIKFKAKTLSLPVALDVGRVTFHFLFLIEWLFAALIVVSGLVTWSDLSVVTVVLFAAYIAILLVQQLYFLPRLDRRIDAIIGGEHPEKSSLHHVYAGLEVVKVVLLLIIGFVA